MESDGVFLINYAESFGKKKMNAIPCHRTNEENQILAARLMRFVQEDNFTGVCSLLFQIDEKEKKKIASTEVEGHVPLHVAVTRGNESMVKFLVEGWQANIEGEGDSRPGTPLWWAASMGALKIVKLLHEHGANINVVSRDGMTPVNIASFLGRIEIVKYLVSQRADVNIPNNLGQTCLMNSAQHWEIGKILIEIGTAMNARDNAGNTALHHAIMDGNLETIKLLLDRGSDQSITNDHGDDALQFACLLGKQVVVNELISRQKNITLLHLYKSCQLLGISVCLSGNLDNAKAHWKMAIAIRNGNDGEELVDIGPSPLCFSTMEVNSMEDLNNVCASQEQLLLYIIENLLQIIGPYREETTIALLLLSKIFSCNMKYEESFKLLRYALRLLNDITPAWTKLYLSVLKKLHDCLQELDKSKFKIEFHEVHEILDMVTVTWQDAKKVDSFSISYSMQLILWFVEFIMRLDKCPDQKTSFKKAVYRLVRSPMKEWKDIRDEDGQTFLHHAVKKGSYQGVTEKLLECDADVNAIDAHNNTALHLCTQQQTSFGSVLPDELNKVTKLLLQYSADVDIVNDSGDLAAKGLSLNMLNHRSLQCLATAVIRDRQIPYVGQIPKSLESFVRMHGRCPSNTFPRNDGSAIPLNR